MCVKTEIVPYQLEASPHVNACDKTRNSQHTELAESYNRSKGLLWLLYIFWRMSSEKFLLASVLIFQTLSKFKLVPVSDSHSTLKKTFWQKRKFPVSSNKSVRNYPSCKP